MLTRIANCIIIILGVMKMELLQLTYFCSAAETENFSKTAQEYRVPASNISQSIHRLEKELDCSLFDRSTNRLWLNEQGKLFYENVKSALKLIDEAKTKLSDKDHISGEIRILTEANRNVVTKAIENFQENYKNVSFYVNHTSDGSPDKYNLIISDKLFNQKYLKKHLLIVDRIFLAIRKDNPLATKKEISVKDLENEQFITMGTESGITKITKEICHMAGFIPNITVQSDDPFYIRKYVELGLGISFFPSVSWGGMFSDNIVCREIIKMKRDTFVYFNTQKYTSKAAELFLEILLKEAAKMQENDNAL